MIVVEKPSIIDIYIPKPTSGGGYVKKGTFGKKDILELLSHYITVEEFAAYTASTEYEIARLREAINPENNEI